MQKDIFLPGDILIPADTDMTLWSIIACDQFSSEPDYWKNIESQVGSSPSTYNMMLPEAYLKLNETGKEAGKIGAAMKNYLDSGVFQTVSDSYIYVERRLPGKKIRKGLVGILDLEYFDYSAGSTSPIRPTEGTVEDRLPPRVEIRRQAPLEMPHIILFIDDPENTVIAPVGTATDGLKKLYDFDLIGGGGHITGWQVEGSTVSDICRSLNGLENADTLSKKYNGINKSPVVFAVGDGNHSLAAAKLCWEQIKETLCEEEINTHPARFSLVEIVNLHDGSIEFEPIHRVIFNTDPDAFLFEAEEFMKKSSKAGDKKHVITCLAGEKKQNVYVSGHTIGDTIGLAERFCQSYCEKYGGRLDYIHGADTTEKMASKQDSVGMLLPKIDKKELFPSIMKSGAFPRKSFSIGSARDKRYYLECRKIVK